MKGHLHSKVYDSTINNSQSMERAEMSIDGWIKKKRCLYTHTHTCTCAMEYYLAIKKNEILPFATTWVDLEYIMLSKISESGKDRYHMTSLICGI